MACSVAGKSIFISRNAVVEEQKGKKKTQAWSSVEKRIRGGIRWTGVKHVLIPKIRMERATRRKKSIVDKKEAKIQNEIQVRYSTRLKVGGTTLSVCNCTAPTCSSSWPDTSSDACSLKLTLVCRR